MADRPDALPPIQHHHGHGLRRYCEGYRRYVCLALVLTFAVTQLVTWTGDPAADRLARLEEEFDEAELSEGLEKLESEVLAPRATPSRAFRETRPADIEGGPASEDKAGRATLDLGVVSIFNLRTTTTPPDGDDADDEDEDEAATTAPAMSVLARLSKTTASPEKDDDEDEDDDDIATTSPSGSSAKTSPAGLSKTTAPPDNDDGDDEEDEVATTSPAKSSLSGLSKTTVTPVDGDDEEDEDEAATTSPAKAVPAGLGKKSPTTALPVGVDSDGKAGATTLTVKKVTLGRGKLQATTAAPEDAEEEEGSADKAISTPLVQNDASGSSKSSKPKPWKDDGDDEGEEAGTALAAKALTGATTASPTSNDEEEGEEAGTTLAAKASAGATTAAPTSDDEEGGAGGTTPAVQKTTPRLGKEASTTALSDDDDVDEDEGSGTTLPVKLKAAEEGSAKVTSSSPQKSSKGGGQGATEEASRDDADKEEDEGAPSSKEAGASQTPAPSQLVEAEGPTGKSLGGDKVSKALPEDLEATVLDIFCQKKKKCLTLRNAGLKTYRSVLAVGVSTALPFLQKMGFYVWHVNWDTAAATELFNEGHPSLLWDYANITRLPFTDFAADVVILNLTACLAQETGSVSPVVSQMVRLLTPAGMLVLVGVPEDTTSLDLKELPPAPRALLLPGPRSNVFFRLDGEAEGVPVCHGCAMGSSYTGECQPHVQGGYASLNQTNRKTSILEDPPLHKARLHHWPVFNVLKTEIGPPTWCDNTSKRDHGWFQRNHASQDPNKIGFVKQFDNWIKSGKVKSLLDAGAGACTLEGHLRITGSLKRLKPYMAFGANDCSMLRICAERSAISFQWNWANPLPVCPTCKFDLVFQVEGVHHLKKEEWKPSWTQLMDRVACKGHLFLADRRCKEEDYYIVYGTLGKKKWCWMDSVQDWAATAGHSSQRMKATRGRSHVLLQKKC